jgi:hypothetical protein
MGRAEQVEGRVTSMVASCRRFRRARPETVERWRREYLCRPSVVAGLRHVRRVAARPGNAERQLVQVIAASANLLRRLRLLNSELNRQQFVRYATGLGALYYRQRKCETEAHAIRRAKVIARTAAELQLRISSRRLQSPVVQVLIATTCVRAGQFANGMIERQSPSAINVAIDGCVVWLLGRTRTVPSSIETLNAFHNDVHSLLVQA